MKLTKVQKKYIKSYYKNKPIEQLALDLKVPAKEIEDFLKEKGKDVVKSQNQNIKPEIPKVPITTIKQIKEILWDNKLTLGIVILFIAVAYFNSLFNGFVSDDIPAFQNSPLVRDFWGSLRSLSTSHIMYTLSYYFFKTNPFPLHLASIILHTIVTLLVFLFVYINWGEKKAVIVTLLFATHPINAEAVNWVSANPYLWLSISTLLVLINYSIFKISKIKKFFWFTAATYILGLIFTQAPIFLVTPIILFIMDQLVYERKVNVKSGGALIMLYGVVNIIYYFLRLQFLAADRIATLKAVYFLNPENTEPFWIRIPYIIAKVAYLFVFPQELTFYHEGDIVVMSVIWGITLGLIGLLTFFLVKKNLRYLAGLMLIIPVTFLPSFSPVQISWYVAERYLYFSTTFFCLILGTFFLWIEKKLKLEHFAIVATIVLLVTYTVRTAMRSTEWKDERTLWFATQRISPNSPQVYNNLGDLYAKDGNLKKSAESFQKAIQLYPSYTAAYHNLGNTYLMMNDLNNAEASYKKAVELNPILYQSISNLGVVNFRKGLYDISEDYFKRALEINPNLPEAVNGINTIQNMRKNDQLSITTGTK